MSEDSLGDRMKMLEGQETNRQLLPLLPICVRLDGKAFHSYTRGFARPYDMRVVEAMQETTKYLVHQTKAVIGYTQSDEISLILYSNNYLSQTFFDRKIFKLTSVLASMCTYKFNEFKLRPEPAFFDCRVWNTPTQLEAVNTLIWREQDATRNSISSAAQSVYSHKELLGKSCAEMQEMLFQKGINWNNYPDFFKRGSYYSRKTVQRLLTAEEKLKIPEEHREKGSGIVTRTEISNMALPPLTKIKNRIEVVFNSAKPILEEVP